jgi:hypothetical protein
MTEPISLAAFIKASIDWDHARDFDLDLDRIVARFPDITEVDFEHALTTVAAELRGDGRRLADQALLDKADAFDEMTHEWVERLRARVCPPAASHRLGAWSSYTVSRYNQ